MEFDPENEIVKLCARGMEMEGAGKNEEAKALFLLAWQEAKNEMEKFTAAHYAARHQSSAADKLQWDERALHLALKIPGDKVKGAYPSLYLNIAKGYEDLGDRAEARKAYELALSFAPCLPDDGYGRMIRAGISSGLNRIYISAQ